MLGRPRLRSPAVDFPSILRPAALLCLLFGLSCHPQRHSHRERLLASTQRVEPPAATPDEETPTVLQRLSALELYLKEHGYRPADPVLNGLISPGETLTIHREAKDESRLIAVALSDADQVPLDMEVLDEDGEPITRDGTPALRTVVTFVVDSQTRFSIRLIADNAPRRARFALAVFAAPLDTPAAAVFELFEHDPVPRLDLDKLAHRLEGLGFQSEQEALYGQNTAGSAVVKHLELLPDRCYIFAATGSRSVDSLTMRVKEGGRLLVSDVSARPDAICHYCTDKKKDVQVIIDVTAGTGSISLKALHGPHTVLGEIFGPTLNSENSSGDIDCRLDALAEKLARLGFGPPRLRARLGLANGERATVSFEVPRGCHLLATVSATTLIDVDASLTNHDTIQSDPSPHADPEFTFCCNKDRCRYTADFIALEGHGELAAATFGVGGSPGPLGEINFAQAASRSIFARSGLVPSHPQIPWSPVDPDEDTASSEIVSIPAGACRGFALSPASQHMSVSLVSTEGSQLASSSSPIYDSLLLVHCARKNSSVRLRCIPAAACRKGVLRDFKARTDRAP